MKTFYATSKEINAAVKWFVIDAEDLVLGRLATETARRLRGKHKAIYTPSMDTGDYVVIINAEKIRLTGKKREDKVYHWHSRYPSGLKSRTVREELEGRFPERVITRAVKGMMPKNKMGRQMLRKLKVYTGPEHPHAGQAPEPLVLQTAHKERV
ncbi:MAG: 50S ribosomal protein L13 [Magnetococcales bacterium]|nr:50S ribosomal protein L13 [Magnetococcales bacterium]MBF0150453.1 50S ribosomal protein L13 [Magnetococcales bacterium]MBF0172756.1 50S ribosomal protein L13 [Magnetococcales bacterium]MBF0347488.1 50S ribosomal protein L13 [Magnetococcales bacterium]MBF0630053.1 50S ribosomal protein L13 [Magnetococcales bacterium]